MSRYFEKALRSDEKSLLWFCSIIGLELSEKYALLLRYDSVDEIFADSLKAKLPDEINQRVREISERSARNFSEDRIRNELWKLNAEFISVKSEQYPERFKVLEKPPLGFFLIGSLPDENIPSIAVVGARACSDYGLNICHTFTKELTEGGVCIISGMAHGIDGASHKACMEAGGKTIAILGNGIGTIYPVENKEIYDRVPEKGGIISEYYVGCKGLKNHFPERNRLIAGLSDGLLVIEARKKSGTMITVNHTLEQGKDVFVIPGRLSDPLSEGCLELIKKGAQLVTEVNDIAFALKDKYPDFVIYHKDKDSQYSFLCPDKNNEKKAKNPGLTTEEKRILSFIGYKPIYFDELVMRSGMDYFTVVETVDSLKNKGFIKDSEGSGLCIASEKK